MCTVTKGIPPLRWSGKLLQIIFISPPYTSSRKALQVFLGQWSIVLSRSLTARVGQLKFRRRDPSLTTTVVSALAHFKSSEEYPGETSSYYQNDVSLHKMSTVETAKIAFCHRYFPFSFSKIKWAENRTI